MLPLLKQCLVVGTGGFLGAVARFLLNNWVISRVGNAFPWGIFVINVSGSFLLGFFVTLLARRVLISDNWRLLVPVGFVGAYTTFSTFEYDNARLGASWQAFGNAAGSVVAGYVAVALGIWLGHLWPQGRG